MAYECSVDYEFLHDGVRVEGRNEREAEEKARDRFKEMTNDGHAGMIQDMWEPQAECWEV